MNMKRLAFNGTITDFIFWLEYLIIFLDYAAEYCTISFISYL